MNKLPEGKDTRTEDAAKGCLLRLRELGDGNALRALQSSQHKGDDHTIVGDSSDDPQQRRVCHPSSYSYRLAIHAWKSIISLCSTQNDHVP